MRRNTLMKRKFLAGIAAATTAVLAACGGGNSGGSSPTASSTASSPCPAGSGTSGNGATVSIGSKAFAEGQLMAQMNGDVLQAHGFQGTHTFQAKTKAIGTALTN